MASYLIASTMGEIFACTVRVPVEVVKQKMQVKQYMHFNQAVSSIYRNEGILAFYRGFAPTISREIPFACIQFPLYENLKKIYESRKETSLGGYESAITGAISGGFAAAVTTPFDVIKTRTILSSRNDINHSGIISTFKHIIKTDGAARLFSGIAPRVLWISLGGSIFFGAYERAQTAFSS